MSDVEHRALAEFFIASPLLLCIPLGVWIVYLVKVINFNGGQLSFPQNQFLYALTLQSAVKQICSLLVTLALQFMPALAYALFLIVVAIKQTNYNSVIFILVSSFLLLMTGALVLFRQVNQMTNTSKVTWVKRYLDITFTRPIIQFYLEHLTRKDPALIFGTKIFSGLLIFAVTQLYSGESYDGRLLGMGCVLAFSANFMIVAQVHFFENRIFILLRNLPMTIFNRISTFIVVFSILCFPETVILIKYYPDVVGWIHAPSFLFFGVSIGVLFYGLLFTQAFRLKNFERPIFALVISWILLILFHVPTFILACVNFCAGLLAIRNCFYRFEFPSQDE
jgi:hypothetical protein